MFKKSGVDIYCWNIMNGPLILIISALALAIFFNINEEIINDFKLDKFFL